MPRGRFWRRIHRGIVVGPLWTWSVWFAAVMVVLVLGLIAWGLLPRSLPLPAEKEALILPPPPKAVVLEATGYSQSVEEGTADGVTASELPVAGGMAAADPAVLPPGTVILVPGYGYTLVGDIGSAII